MLNPSELQGEVDHSFFDSDCDDSSTSKDGKKLKGLNIENGSPSTHESLNVKQTEKSNAGLSLRTDGMNKDHEQEVHDMDDYSQSPNETEKEASPSRNQHSDIKSRNKQSPKKLRGNWRTRSPSPASTETDADADSESSCGSNDEISSLGSPTFPKRKASSLTPRERKVKVGLAGSGDMTTSHTVESEDTVTDVSPLSSPDSSSFQSVDLNHKEADDCLKDKQMESVPSSGLSNTHQDEDSDQDVDEYSRSSGSQLGGKVVLHCPGARNRKNYSFSNDEVRRIDQENQRLLRELSRLSPGLRPGSIARKKTNMANTPPLIRLSHSALNRQREQQRIERENLAFLKRLESVKPTPGLRRSEQLANYQRQIGYLGARSYPICGSTTKKEWSASRTNSAGPSPSSSTHLRSRAVSVNADSSTLVSRSKKPNTA